MKSFPLLPRINGPDASRNRGHDNLCHRGDPIREGLKMIRLVPSGSSSHRGQRLWLGNDRLGSSFHQIQVLVDGQWEDLLTMCFVQRPEGLAASFPGSQTRCHGTSVHISRLHQLPGAYALRYRTQCFVHVPE